MQLPFTHQKTPQLVGHEVRPRAVGGEQRESTEWQPQMYLKSLYHLFNKAQQSNQATLPPLGTNQIK